MRSILQYGLLVVLIAAIVFGLTFFRQSTSSPIEKPVVSAGPGEVSGPPLRIRLDRARWDPDEPNYAAEFEQGSGGQDDFWVSNEHDAPVTVALIKKSCVCNEVDVAIVPPAEIEAWRDRLQKLSPLRAALALIGAPDWTGATAVRELSGLHWTALTPRDRDATAPGVKVPAADPARGPQWAIIRMKWDGREAKGQSLTADVQHRIGSVAESTQFSVPVLVVPPVIISSPVVMVGDLQFNDRREQTLYAWSSTRDQFQLKIEERSPHPCIEIGPPRLLSAAERVEAVKSLRAAGLIGPTKWRAAYAIPIVVYERKDGAQLDLGPLSRRVQILNDVSKDAAAIMIQGMVRGAIEIGEDADRDRVNLGSFRADRPHEKVIEVRAKDPNLQVRFKSATPEYLQVKLTETSAGSAYRRWKLQVEIEADRVSGFLPPNSAILLETVADPPRLIRIPVVGNATVR